MLKYRADIDGLRAVAVLPVVFFHAGVSAFSGGFVGVDIFFVISGFLITQILISNISTGEFSVIKFYERRIRRIFPALFLVIFLTAIAALFILMPKELIDFGSSVSAAAGFGSNILFWLESDYFGADADTKLLLHTWSLAVEEQFYIFFPIFLYFMHKYFPRRLLLSFFILATASFVLSVWAIDRYQTAVFYLAPSRGWELLLGSALALKVIPPLTNSLQRDSISIVGLGLIAWAVFTYSAQVKFPGAAALVPCLGAAMLIYSGLPEPALVNRVFAFKPLVWTGLISYPLYLWHWPIIVSAKLILIRDLNLAELTLVVLVSFAGAIFTYKFIETPFRNRRILQKRTALFFAAGIMIGVSLIYGVAMHMGQGFPERLPPDVVQLASGQSDNNVDRGRCHSIPIEKVLAGDICKLGPGADDIRQYVVWGDSHADAVMPVLKSLAEENSKPGWHASYTRCAPLLWGSKKSLSNDAACKSFNEAMFEFIVSHDIKKVILIAFWSSNVNDWLPEKLVAYDQPEQKSDSNADDAANRQMSSEEAITFALKKTAERLIAHGVKIYIVLEPPQVSYFTPLALARARLYGLPEKDIGISLETHRSHHAGVLRILEDVNRAYPIHRIDIATALCDSSLCKVEDRNRSLYRDSHHLSAYGALYVKNVFRPFFLPDNNDVFKSNE